MKTVWFTPEEFPESRFQIRPLSADSYWDWEAAAASKFPGEALTRIFRSAVVNWENAPLFPVAQGKVLQSYDALRIPEIEGQCKFYVCMEAARISQLTEDELKNYESPST